jgi:hypothetical protein
MSKPILLLACHIFLGSISCAAAAPLDSPGTIYIDGLPCNQACQEYMAWSREASGRDPGARAQSGAAQAVAPKVRNVTRLAPHKPAPKPVAMQPSPKRAPQMAAKESIQTPSIPAATMGSDKTANKPETKPAPVETTLVPTPSLDPRAEPADTPPAQVATVPPAQEPEVSVPSPVLDSAKPTTPSAAAVATNPPETNTAALGSPNAEQAVAILLVREEIKSLTELSNKTVAIDGLQAAEIPNIKTAIMKSGAKDVRISEDEKLALDRVMNGEVPAGVISVVSPEEAAQWTGVPGYTVLRLPLQRTTRSPG